MTLIKQFSIDLKKNFIGTLW